MAKLLAGTLLILLGAGSAYIGWQEIVQPIALTSYAAATTLILGVFMVLTGLAHFRAPHKSFLASLALLAVFQFHLYSLALFYEVENLYVFLGGFLMASILILVLSYRSFRLALEPDEESLTNEGN